MKRLLQLEELAEFGLSIFLFYQLPYAWWVYPALLFTPDLSLLALVAGRQIGSILYNTLHHKGLAVGLYILGMVFHLPPLALAGAVLLGHTSFDRLMGLGLMDGKTFTHAHLKLFPLKVSPQPR